MPVFHFHKTCCPGPVVVSISFAHHRQHHELTLNRSAWQTQARFDTLTQGRIWEDPFDACPTTTQPLDSTCHPLCRGEAQATVVVANNPNFCQQLIIPKTGIKASTASLKHLKERDPRSKTEYWDWTSQPFQYWTQHEAYFILAANVKRCVKAGLSTMRKCTTREDGTRGRDGGLQLPRSSAICLLRFWCFFAASQSLTPKSKHALKNALWENIPSACFLV